MNTIKTAWQWLGDRLQKLWHHLKGYLGLTALLLVIMGCAQSPAFAEQQWKVTRIYDGDTIVAQSGPQTIKLRLCGIDAPERSQSLGRLSTMSLKQILGQGNNTITFDGQEMDRYGRIIAEIFTQGPEGEIYVNAEQTRRGMAYYYSQYAVNCPGRQAILEGQQQAEAEALGVWHSPQEKPWDYRHK